MHYLNETWVVYTAGVAAEMKPLSHTTRKIRGRVRGILIARRFSKNGGAIKAHSTETERATDF